MRKVLVLGGCGTIGSEAVRDLVRTSEFDEIVVGDFDMGKADGFVKELKDGRLSTLKVDIEETESLANKFKEFDVVTSALPFRYDLRVTMACVKASVNGIDVFTEKSQFSFHGDAKRAGISYIVGCGMTPGVTNILARKGADALDSVEEIHIAWASYRCLAPAPGLLYTTLWEFDPVTKERAYYQDGKLHSVPPFSGAEKVEFASSIGPQEVYYVSHPEPQTIPRYIEGVKLVDVKGTWPPETMRLLRCFLDFGFFNKKNVHIRGVELTPEDLIYGYFLQTPEAKETALWGYSVNVRVHGVKNGKKIKKNYTTTHPHMDRWGRRRAYAKNVGIPLSIGTQMLANGQIKKRGVFAPEAVIEPEFFLGELAKRGITVIEKTSSDRKKQAGA